MPGMMTMNRRDLCVLLSAFTAMAASPAESSAELQAAAAQLTPANDPVLSKSRAFPFDQLPVSKSASGESRAVIHGVLATGEAVEVHETTLLPGHMPHPPHKHPHSEFVLVREGTMEFDNDGKPERVGPGGVFFAASNVMHGAKNIGETNANYFVVAVGRQSAAQTT